MESNVGEARWSNTSDLLLLLMVVVMVVVMSEEGRWDVTVRHRQGPQNRSHRIQRDELR